MDGWMEEGKKRPAAVGRFLAMSVPSLARGAEGQCLHRHRHRRQSGALWLPLRRVIDAGYTTSVATTAAPLSCRQAADGCAPLPSSTPLRFLYVCSILRLAACRTAWWPSSPPVLLLLLLCTHVALLPFGLPFIALPTESRRHLLSSHPTTHIHQLVGRHRGGVGGTRSTHPPGPFRGRLRRWRWARRWRRRPWRRLVADGGGSRRGGCRSGGVCQDICLGRARVGVRHARTHRARRADCEPGRVGGG